jgi:hypothetical protein
MAGEGQHTEDIIMGGEPIVGRLVGIGAVRIPNTPVNKELVVSGEDT